MRRKSLPASENAKEFLKDEEIFGAKIDPMEQVAQPFNQQADGITQGKDRDGVEWVGEGIELDVTVPKNGVFS